LYPVPIYNLDSSDTNASTGMREGKPSFIVSHVSPLSCDIYTPLKEGPANRFEPITATEETVPPPSVVIFLQLLPLLSETKALYRVAANRRGAFTARSRISSSSSPLFIGDQF